jgi:uncharacterized protein (DUF4415 family)
MYSKYMIFYVFIVPQFSFWKAHMTDKKSEPLQTEFDATAAPPACKLAPAEAGGAGSAPSRVSVTLDMDADLLAWLMMQPTDWQREINNTMRFFMETSAAPASPRKPYGRKTDIFPF